MRIQLAVVIAGLSILAACTTQSTNSPVVATSTTTPAVAAPASRPVAPAAPVQTSAPDELPPGIGREAVLKGCGGCHGVGQILSERRSRTEWADTVTMMITQGAPVTEAEFDTVVTYLATQLGAR